MINQKQINNDLIKLADEKVKEEDFLSAIEYYKKYLEIDPQNAVIYNRIGHLYGKINGFEYVDEQIKYFNKALKINPKYSGAMRNLALLYAQTDKIQKSTECFHKLFELEPVTDDYFAYACLKIKSGDFEEGWKYYEFRFLKGWGREDYIETSKPRWEGEDLSGKTLLVQYEQGFGDSIQFVRYIKTVKNIYPQAEIIFRVQNELVDLLKTNFEDIDVVGRSVLVENLSFDYHIPLLSLLRLTNAKIENIPFANGYIKADKNKTKIYRKEFFKNNNLKIGISWNGTQTGNHSRDIPLKCFYPLSQIEGVSLYSLQKGYGAKQLKNVPENIEITDLGKTFQDFSDSAAAMANLDLFITSDNALLNLAGAMDVKTCLLLNKNAEWRWFSDDEKTPWYDSVKIYKKQTEDESWDSLFKKVVEEKLK